MKVCLYCIKPLDNVRSIYCSNKCQNDLQYESYVKDWKLGLKDGGRGKVTRNFSGHIIRYLRETHGDRCKICGWNTRHPTTGRIPLEIDHIDGNSENNRPENLQLLCPNCHSLTSNYRNLNSGKGREWRRLKYIRT